MPLIVYDLKSTLTVTDIIWSFEQLVSPSQCSQSATDSEEHCHLLLPLIVHNTFFPPPFGAKSFNKMNLPRCLKMGPWVIVLPRSFSLTTETDMSAEIFQACKRATSLFQTCSKLTFFYFIEATFTLGNSLKKRRCYLFFTLAVVGTLVGLKDARLPVVLGHLDQAHRRLHCGVAGVDKHHHLRHKQARRDNMDTMKREQ